MLNETELQFVTFMHQQYALTGELLSKDAAFEKFGITPKMFERLITQENIKDALEERGINLSRYTANLKSKDAWKAQALTPEQLLVANTMLDLVDTRSQKKKLQDLGVSTSTYDMWLRDPVFNDYLRNRAESLLGDNQHEAHLALVDKVRSGDINAIKYLNEMTGRFVPATNSGSGTNVAVQVEQLLINILEIINDEVHDPDTALRIAERFKTLMTARTIAGALLEDSAPIETPKIAPARELSPKLQALVDMGEGINS